MSNKENAAARPAGYVHAFFAVYLPIAAALVLIVGLGVVQGQWSNRWGGDGVAAERLAEKLAGVPHVLGDWHGVDQEQDPRELEAAGAVGHIARTYRNVRTGERVSMYLICGQTRDISQHTPDRCYPAAGFSTLAQPEEYTMTDIGGVATEFFAATFRRQSPEGIADLRVYWTWGHGGRWEAHEWPRKAYGGIKAIYKLYFMETLTPQSGGDGNSACDRFGQEMLPLLTETLFDSDPA